VTHTSELLAQEVASQQSDFQASLVYEHWFFPNKRNSLNIGFNVI
jgi:hypothetical protein